MISLAIVITGIGSYAMRAFFIFALARYAFPPIFCGRWNTWRPPLWRL